MIVVLDTNVVLQALSPRHPYALIMDAWFAGRFIWALPDIEQHLRSP
jgi:hypothetical protein